MTNRLHRRLSIALLLLLLFVLVRLTAIEVFPLFLDETTHIDLGERALTTSPFYDAFLGRVFTGWLHYAVQSYANEPIWTGRVITVLAVLPGVAAVLAIGYMAAGLWGLSLAGLFYVFSAYHMFFERMALADPVSSSAVLVALYFAFRLSRRIHWFDAVAAGLMLFIGFGAKISILPYMVILVVAPFTLGRYTLAQRVRWMAQGLASAGVLCGGYVIFLRLLGYDYLTNSVSLGLTGRAETGVMERLLNNLNPAVILSRAQAILTMLSGYLGIVVLIAAVLAVLVLIWRRKLFLPLMLLVPTFGMWVNLTQETRFWIPATTILLLSLAIVLADLLQTRPMIFKLATLGGIALWALTMWLPYITITDPLRLPLPQWDVDQYIESDATGFGMTALGDTLIEQEAQTVIGILANCLALKYTYLHDLNVLCPQISPDGKQTPALVALMDDNQQAGWYAVIEAIDYLPDSAPGELVVTIERPTSGPGFAIYHLGG